MRLKIERLISCAARFPLNFQTDQKPNLKSGNYYICIYKAHIMEIIHIYYTLYAVAGFLVRFTESTYKENVYVQQFNLFT